MDSKGVSPMIATIVLIAIVFAVAAILALSLASAPTPTQPFGGTFSLENVENGKDVIVIKHMGGDKAVEALIGTGSTPLARWRNLELRVDGVVKDNIFEFVSEGKLYKTTTTQGTTYTLVVGDIVKVKLDSALREGSKVVLVWVPRNQALVEKEVPR